MTPEQAAKNPYDPFDDSKVWLHADFPLIPVGRFVLNKNPRNYFAEIEQIAFDVAHLIPGIYTYISIMVKKQRTLLISLIFVVLKIQGISDIRHVVKSLMSFMTKFDRITLALANHLF